MVYSGGLTLGRSEALCEFSMLAIQAGSMAGFQVRVIVHSMEPLDEDLQKTFDSNHIIFRGGLSSSKLKAALQSADFLLHVESDREEFKSKTKLSISTKIPEYLSTGVCVIAYGPADISSIKLIKDNCIGIVVAVSDSFELQVEKLSNELSNLISCQNIASKGLKFAFDNFNLVDVRALIDSRINSTADSSS